MLDDDIQQLVKGLIENSVLFKILDISHTSQIHWVLNHQSLHDLPELYYIILFIYTTTTTQCKLPECKSGICASGCKLQWVKPPQVQVESLCQHLREKRHHLHKLLPVTTIASTRCTGQGARCKGQDQHQRKLERDAATTCNSNHHHHRPAQDQHRRWWSARCSNHCNLHKGTN